VVRHALLSDRLARLRDAATLRPREYLVRLPRDLRRRGALLLDPMLATGAAPSRRWRG
jgi:uracil phosphoribosyltransferase